MSYLMHNNKKYEISEETAKELARIFSTNGETTLADVEVGKTFKIEDYEFIVLEHMDGKTAVILKDLLVDSEVFGTNNNYNGSNVDDICNEFADTLADCIGDENIYEFEVDLTAANGMKCYGSIMRKAALLTLSQLQKYAYILAENPVNKWWWLATANGTSKWGSTNYDFCVSPSGYVGINYFSINRGVRPFCIFNSSISVSC